MFAENTTIGDVIGTHAANSPNAAAIVSGDGFALTWGQLQKQILSFRSLLIAQNIHQKDRVAVILPNGPSSAIAFLAISSCAACAPLNPSYRADEIEFCLRDINAKALVIFSESGQTGREVALRLGLKILQLHCSEPSGEFLELASAYDPAAEPGDLPNPDDIALVLHTSGTTARPKTVALSHRNLVHSSRSIANGLSLSATDRCLNVVPLFHVHGLIGGLLAPLISGGVSVCPPTFHPQLFFQWLEASHPTWYTAVPTMHRAIVRAAAAHSDTLRRSRIRLVRSCSSALDESLFEELRRTFRAPIVEAYGMTEAAHQIASNPSENDQQKAGTVGRPTGVEIAILDDDGEILPTGATGEVCIRGISVFAGYENNAQANVSAFINNWFRTGDQGRLDADGYLKLTGRLKDQINRGGEKISPLEIDQVLLLHPDVEEAITFGIPHPTLGEDIAAAVVLRESEMIEPGQIQLFLAERLASFQVPRRILVVDKIPKGPTGKIQRQFVREALAVRSNREPNSSENSEPLPAAATEAKLVELWRHFLGSDHVDIEDDFFDLGGDSISAAEMLLEAERVFEKKLDNFAFLIPLNIRSLAKIIEGSQQAEWLPLLEVQAGMGRARLFFFHGDREDDGIYARRLANLLGKEHGFVSIAPHILSREQIPASIEEMAAERLPRLLAVQSKGPFLLGGACVGGHIALETARLLIQAGHEVESVIMIDSPLLNARPSMRSFYDFASIVCGKSNLDLKPRFQQLLDKAWLLGSKAETLIRTPAGTRWTRVSSSIKRQLSSIRTSEGNEQELSRSTPSIEHLQLSERTEAAYLRNLRRYFPKPLEVRIVFFSAEYLAGPLRHLTSNVKLLNIPGGHWSWTNTYLDVLANLLRAEIAVDQRKEALLR